MTDDARMWICIAAIAGAVLVALIVGVLAYNVRELDCRQAAVQAGVRPSEVDDACH